MRYASCRNTSSPSFPLPLSLDRLVERRPAGEDGRAEPSASRSRKAEVWSVYTMRPTENPI